MHFSSIPVFGTVWSMCGIAGIWDKAGTPVVDGAIDRMQKTLVHRGPDDAGTYSGPGVAFAQTRLSIIDLSHAASQPFVSSDSRYVLVFNGEIYNYKELRKKYFAEETFQSDSDTEVLLFMLIRFKADALPHLQGMFAFAFFDTQENSLLLACDAFGKKPLFYTWSGNTFLFASEPKALFASRYVNALLDNDIVAPYLLHEYCPSPASGFAGIYTLGAGQYMEITLDTEKIVRWFRMEIVPKSTMFFQDAKEKFDDLLGLAVERRMVADVPVGLFLSGGLDSSTIGWYMRQVKKEGDIHSCSVAFEDPSFNEEDVASQVASSLRFTHHSATFTKETFLESLHELIPVLDIPLADVSLLPTYTVSKLARKYMKVVLDGDGSDEFLGGYGTFQAYELSKKMAWISKEFWQIASHIAEKSFPVSHTYFSFDFKIKSFLRGVSYDAERAIQVWLGAFSEKEIRSLVKKDTHISLQNIFNTADFAVPATILDPFDRASLYHVQTYLHRDVLVKIDRATMAAGIEARTPFLDTDVAEFLLRLPPSYKRNKRILRELMKGRLPEVVLSRKKQGFGIPSASWFASDLLSFVEDTLSQEKIERTGIFQYAYIKKLIDEHASKQYDHRKKLWTLIVFQLWHERWINGKQIPLSPYPTSLASYAGRSGGKGVLCRP